MMEQENKMSVLDIFSQTQETFEEAKRKSNDESGSKIKNFRTSSDGTYSVRILPIAPVFDKDGNMLPLQRKGYEYPNKELWLEIAAKDDKGKPKTIKISICHTNYAFPDLKCDLIDEYVATVCEKYQNDKKLCEKIKGNSFDGGLKWNSKRCMYIFDADNRADGIQVLSLSYSQYKDLEDRKMKLWEKLLKNGNVPCPISSIKDAFLVEITRKTEKKKTEYSFNIDVASGKDELNEKELEMLLDSPRLPESLYRYNRFHLEATIVFLKQLDEKFQIDVMNEERIKNCIDKISMSLPADDTSHFDLSGKNNSATNSNTGIDTLWDIYDHLTEEGLDDRSEEGQDLRADIKEFIEEEGLQIRVSRGKSNRDLLEEIDDILSSEKKESTTAAEEEEDEPAPAQTSNPDPEPEESEEEEEDDEDDEDRPAATPTTRAARSRNDDTNEPAARTERRSARPERRRR